MIKDPETPLSIPEDHYSLATVQFFIRVLNEIVEFSLLPISTTPKDVKRQGIRRGQIKNAMETLYEQLIPEHQIFVLWFASKHGIHIEASLKRQ